MCRTSVQLKDVFKKHRGGTRDASFCSSTGKAKELRRCSGPQQSYASAHCSKCVLHLLRVLLWRLGPMSSFLAFSTVKFQVQWRVRLRGSSLLLVYPMWSSSGSGIHQALMDTRALLCTHGPSFLKGLLTADFQTLELVWDQGTHPGVALGDPVNRNFRRLYRWTIKTTLSSRSVQRKQKVSMLGGESWDHSDPAQHPSSWLVPVVPHGGRYHSPEAGTS